MTLRGPSAPARVRSRGWRSVWFGRIGLGSAAVFLVAYSYALFGWPWQDRGAAIYLAIGVVILGLYGILIESFRPRWVAVSTTGATFGYLFGAMEVPWSRLQRATVPPARTVAAVAYEDLGWRRNSLRRYHWTTREQSDLISVQMLGAAGAGSSVAPKSSPSAS
jgi:hypothetical protein